MTDIITVKRNNPEHTFCSNWQFPHGIVLGNGPSRHRLDLHKLKENAAIYGCNALFRDFQSDFLFANDSNMILEILRADYTGRCIFHEWDRIPMEQADSLQFYTSDGDLIPLKEKYGDPQEAEEFIYIPHPDHMVFVYLSPNISEQYTFVKKSYAWGAGTGINALYYALKHGGHKHITIYGFDSFTVGSWSNIYDGSPQYKEHEGYRAECKEKGIKYVPTHGEEWSEHIHFLKAAYPNVEVKMK